MAAEPVVLLGAHDRDPRTVGTGFDLSKLHGRIGILSTVSTKLVEGAEGQHERLSNGCDRGLCGCRRA